MINDKGEEVGIIYGWYCIKTGKWYIGQTVNPEKRFNCHISEAINKKDNIYFHNALRRYGLENFVYCILEENILRDNLNMKEQEWIEYYDSFHSGYNLTLGGDGVRGVVISEEIRRKIAEKLKGQHYGCWKRKHFSEEHKRKLSESQKGPRPWMIGKHRSEESRRKMSESHKGQLVGEKNPFYGKHHSEESRKRMSESHKKKVNKYNLDGSYIQTYNSVAEAIKNNTKCSGLGQVCNGKAKQAGGFIWKYAS